MYVPPKDAVKDRKCRLQIAHNITSTALREASKVHDELYFNGHGNLNTRINPNWKSGMPMSERNIQTPTTIAFADGNYRLSEVLSLEPKSVKSTVIYVDICFDAFVDTENPSGIKVEKIEDVPKPVKTAGILEQATIMQRHFWREKCCTVDVSVSK